MIPLGDLAFSVVATITITVTIASEGVSDNDDTVVDTAIALFFLQDTAFVKLEIAR